MGIIRDAAAQPAEFDLTRRTAERDAEAAEYASLLGWTVEEGAWLADFMEDHVTSRAACGEPFVDLYALGSHELHCGACQGAKEADDAAYAEILALAAGTPVPGTDLVRTRIYTCDWCDAPSRYVVDHGQDFACAFHFGYHFEPAIAAGDTFRIVRAPNR